MYAIVQQGGHQFRVSPGDRLVVDRLAAEVGTVVALEPVLLVHDGSEATVGTPIVAGTRVAAVVVSHTKGRKIRVFKYKAKKRYRRTHGHRSQLTELRVQAVVGAGEPLPAVAAPRVARKADSRGASGTSLAKAEPAKVVPTSAAVAEPVGDETGEADTETAAAAPTTPSPRGARSRAAAPVTDDDAEADSASDKE